MHETRAIELPSMLGVVVDDEQAGSRSVEPSDSDVGTDVFCVVVVLQLCLQVETRGERVGRVERENRRLEASFVQAGVEIPGLELSRKPILEPVRDRRVGPEAGAGIEPTPIPSA